MAFGSHGGEDHYVITNADEVERLLQRDAQPSERSLFRDELAAVAPYEKTPSTRARIQLAMLYLADGDLEQLRKARQVADRDWRDLLMLAEYPSTPPPNTLETADQKQARQQRDIDSIAAWRNRSGPRVRPSDDE